MKVGMIFESGSQGADRQVCEHLAKRIHPDIEIKVRNHANKPEMIDDCGEDVRQLMALGCERVLIIWDLFPAWREKGQKPCRKEDRTSIQESLAASGMQNAPVFLVCITEELEAWLLADGRALSSFLSTTAHPRKVKGNKNPDVVSNPKKRLTKTFQENRRGKYNDLVHAIKIIKKLPDLKHLRQSPSFQRFEEKLGE